MIIVDTNVLAYLFLDSEFTPLAEGVLRKDPVWAAPILWRSEFASVLVQSHRHKGLDLEVARGFWKDAEALLAGREYLAPAEDTLGLAAESGCSAYACEFVALAQILKVPLVTQDSQVMRAFPRATTSMEGFLGEEGQDE